MTSLQEIVDGIQSEITVQSNGVGYATIRGVARLCGVRHQTLCKHFEGGSLEASKLTQSLAAHGFEGGSLESFSTKGIPDTAIALILEYYAFDADPVNRRKEAVLCCRAFSSIGIRSWMQQLTGWSDPSSKNEESISFKELDNRIKTIKQSVDMLQTMGRLNSQRKDRFAAYIENMVDAACIDYKSNHTESSSECHTQNVLTQFIQDIGLTYTGNESDILPLAYLWERFLKWCKGSNLIHQPQDADIRSSRKLSNHMKQRDRNFCTTRMNGTTVVKGWLANNHQ